MTFRVGMKVVAVHDPEAISGDAEGDPVVLGRTYTVRDVDTTLIPFVENSTDISALTALLNPSNHTSLPEDREALENALLEIFEQAMGP